MKRTVKHGLLGIAAIVALLASFTLGFSLRGSDPSHVEMSMSAGQTASLWTCSMHHQIQLPNPGLCPICGMDLIPLEQSTSNEGPRTLTLSDAAIQIAEIQTTPVSRRRVETTLRMVGKLEPDESRTREIAAWVDGRIERLYVDYTGVPVQAGERLFQLYSPALFSAQEELLQAIKAAEELKRSNLESSRLSATRTVEAVRQRLRLWGLTQQQIRDIETRGTASERIDIVAPMSGTVLHKAAVEGAYVKTGTHVYAIADLSVLWLKLDVYEADLSWIEIGQKVRFSTDAFAGEPFEGAVAFIDPVLDERSRTVKVRVDVQNESGRLKPGMFARATVHANVPGSEDGPPMIIPRTATMITGTRAIVYVADPHNRGQYHGREVVLGRQVGDEIVVLDGLRVGERVVSNGAFKIDSALQILAKTSMMNPSGGRPATHDGGAGMQHSDTVPHEFDAHFDAIVSIYLQVSRALSRDDLVEAQEAGEKLPDAIARTPGSLLPASRRPTWKQLQDGLSHEADAIVESQSLETARTAFYDLSLSMIAAVRSFGAEASRTLHVYHCPMARDGAGADWLQDFEGTENPYYGESMFSCGEKTETLMDAATPRSPQLQADH